MANECVKQDCPTCYEAGFHEGWDACHKRFTDILKRFPMQCAMITDRLPLHPSQPDEVLEPIDWKCANGG